jgi:hypothetical protein
MEKTLATTSSSPTATKATVNRNTIVEFSQKVGGRIQKAMGKKNSASQDSACEFAPFPLPPAFCLLDSCVASSVEDPTGLASTECNRYWSGDTIFLNEVRWAASN